MKYIDEFRNKNLIKIIADKITAIDLPGQVNIMEVCGTHTQNFFRFGLGKFMPKNLNFIAGPGCPVCVSAQEYIDKAIAYAREKDVMILTFGDMLRVPGSESTLEKERANGANVAVVYSALDSIKAARQSPLKKIIFLAVGFETTVPSIALTIINAKKENLNNLFFFSSLKTIPRPMESLLQDKRLNLSGFLCPGHVSAIIGTRPYEFIPRKYGIGCCVCGFEPLDILEGTYMLLRQIAENRPKVENQYSRVVTESGNLKAKKIIYTVFEPSSASWRGLGKIPGSGLKIKKEFCRLDIEKVMPIKTVRRSQDKKQKLCRCGDVLKGLAMPGECPLFKKFCSPENPYGPCMVSSEGTCNAYYKYH